MKYWIIIDNTQKGPMTLDELVAHGGVGLSTPVWHEGLSDWTTAGAIPEVAAAITGRMQPQCPPVVAGQQYVQQPYAPQPHVMQPEVRPVDGDKPGKMPNNYLVWAILATICCCVPTGVVAIIYAAKVSPAFMRGDYAAANDASSKAELWTIISFVAGLIWAPFSIIFSLL